MLYELLNLSRHSIPHKFGTLTIHQKKDPTEKRNPIERKGEKRVGSGDKMTRASGIFRGWRKRGGEVGSNISDRSSFLKDAEVVEDQQHDPPTCCDLSPFRPPIRLLRFTSCLSRFRSVSPRACLRHSFDTLKNSSSTSMFSFADVSK